MSDEDLEIQEEADVLEDSEQQAEAEQGPSVEDRAREMGWRPKEEFKGDESRWVDAETFVDNGEKVLPIVQARLRKTEEQLEAARKDAEDRFKRLEAMNEKSRARERAAHEQQLKALEVRKRQAVEEADTDEYDRIEKAQADLRKQQDDDQQPAPQQAPELDQWIQKNQWFRDDAHLNAVATAAANRAAAAGGDVTAEIAAAERAVRAIAPDLFPEPEAKPAPRPAAAPETGSAAGRLLGGNKAKGFSSLPPEAKNDFASEVRFGTFTDDAKGREEYAQAYWSLD